MRNSDQSSPLPAKKLTSPFTKDADENSMKSPTVKNFMSPTISAASKVNNQHSRKKILGERSESPIGSFKDGGDENLLTNQEMGRPDAENLKKPIFSKQFTTPPMKSTASKVNRPTAAVPSSPAVHSFDLMNGNEEFAEEAENWSPFSYDPVRNYLVPRPQFLRYRPNRLGFLEPSAKKGTDSEDEEEDSGSDDEFDEEEFDETDSEGRSIWKRVFQFVLVLGLLVLSTAYITSMNDEPVSIEGLHNDAAVHLHIQESKSYPIPFVLRLEVNGSWLLLDEDGTPSQLEIVKPHIPLEIVKPYIPLAEGEEDEEEEVVLEDEVQEEEDAEEVKKEIPEGEEVAMEDEVQEEEEEGELLSFQQPLFLPLQPAAAEEATKVQEEAQSLSDGRNDQMAASMGRAADDEMVHYREIQKPNDDGVVEDEKFLTNAEIEEKYDYMELDKKLTYELDVDNRPFQGPMLAVIAVASTSVLAVLLFCGITRKRTPKSGAARRNDDVLPRSSNDSQTPPPPPPHSEAPLLPSQDPVDAFIPERTADFKSHGAPTIQLLGEIDGMGPSRSSGGGMKLNLEKRASHVQPQPAANVASASRNSSTTTKSDRKSTTTPSSSSRKKEVTVVGGEREAKKSATTLTPVRRSNRLASRGITSP